MREKLVNWRDLQFDASNPQVYPPKPASLFFADIALNIVQPGQKVLDACTGSGIVGIGVAKYIPNVSVTVSDISPIAVQTAQKNADRNRVSIECVQSDMYSAFKRRTFDVITVHPPAIPYLPNEDWGMTEGMRLATYGGMDGSLIVERSIREATAHLTDNGILLLLLPRWSNIPKAMSLLKQQYAEVRELGRKNIDFFPYLDGKQNPILLSHLRQLASQQIIDMEFPPDAPPQSSVSVILAS